MFKPATLSAAIISIVALNSYAPNVLANSNDGQLDQAKCPSFVYGSSYQKNDYVEHDGKFYQAAHNNPHGYHPVWSTWFWDEVDAANCSLPSQNNTNDTRSVASLCSEFVYKKSYQKGDKISLDGQYYEAAHNNPGGWHPVWSPYFWNQISASACEAPITTTPDSNAAKTCQTFVYKTPYSVGDVVTLDDKYYEVVNNNQGGWHPVWSPYFWKAVDASACEAPNTGKPAVDQPTTSCSEFVYKTPYAVGDEVSLDGKFYRVVNNNQGGWHPVWSPYFWEEINQCSGENSNQPSDNNTNLNGGETDNTSPSNNGNTTSTTADGDHERFLSCVKANAQCDLSQWYEQARPSYKAHPSSGDNVTLVNNWSALKSALQNARPGEIVYVQAGTLINVPPNQTLYNIMGTANNKVVLTTDPTNPAILDGSRSSSTYLRFSSAEYLEISHLKIHNFTHWGLMFGITHRANGGSGLLQSVSGTNRHIDVFNVELKNIDNAAVVVHANSHDVLLSGLKIHGMRTPGVHWSEGIYIGEGQSSTATMIDRPRNVTVEYTEIFNRNAEAIDVKPGATNVTLRNNYIHDININSQGMITAGWRSTNTSNAKVGDTNFVIEGNILRSSKLRTSNGFEAQGLSLGGGNATIKGNVFADIQDHRMLYLEKRFERGFNNVTINDNTFHARSGQRGIASATGSYRLPTDGVMPNIRQSNNTTK